MKHVEKWIRSNLAINTVVICGRADGTIVLRATNGIYASGSCIESAQRRLDQSFAAALAGEHEPTRPNNEIPTRDPERAPDTRPTGTTNWPEFKPLDFEETHTHLSSAKLKAAKVIEGTRNA